MPPLQHDAQDAVDAEPGVPEAGVRERFGLNIARGRGSPCGQDDAPMNNKEEDVTPRRLC